MNETPRADQVESRVARVPALVSFDLPCVLCGVNLKRRAATALCPKCGITVAKTYQPTLLHFSGSATRQSIRRALLIMMFSPLGIVIGVVVAVSLEMQLLNRTGVRLVLGTWAGVCVSMATLAISAWLLTRAPNVLAFQRGIMRVVVWLTRILSTLLILSIASTLAIAVWSYEPRAMIDWKRLGWVIGGMFANCGIVCALMLCVLLLLGRLYESVANHSGAAYVQRQTRAVAVSLVLPPLTVLPALIGPLEFLRLGSQLRRAIRDLPITAETSIATSLPSNPMDAPGE